MSVCNLWNNSWLLVCVLHHSSRSARIAFVILNQLLTTPVSCGPKINSNACFYLSIQPHKNSRSQLKFKYQPYFYFRSCRISIPSARFTDTISAERETLISTNEHTASYSYVFVLFFSCHSTCKSRWSFAWSVNNWFECASKWQHKLMKRIGWLCSVGLIISFFQTYSLLNSDLYQWFASSKHVLSAKVTSKR